jgi:hypothetical protein
MWTKRARHTRTHAHTRTQGAMGGTDTCHTQTHSDTRRNTPNHQTPNHTQEHTATHTRVTGTCRTHVTHKHSVVARAGGNLVVDEVVEGDDGADER